jgi:hypothetical protein
VNRIAQATGILILAASVNAYGQSPARVKLTENDERVLSNRALAAMARLDQEVLVYHSLGEFSESGRLARVPFETFARDLQAVSIEVEPILSAMPQGRLKANLVNALASYQDGASWWQKIQQPRVVNISALKLEGTITTSDSAFLETVPYTVAIHWRQARKYLDLARKSLN